MGRNLVLNEYFASVLRNRNNFSAFNINLFAAVMPDGFKDYTRFTELLTRELESKSEDCRESVECGYKYPHVLIQFRSSAS